MNYEEIPWKNLTAKLYDERFGAHVPLHAQSPVDEDETARLWTEAARRVKLIARKGFRRSISAYDLEDIEQRVLVKLLAEDNLRAAAGALSPGHYIARMIRNEAVDFMRRQLRESFMNGELDERISSRMASAELQDVHERDMLCLLEREFDSLSASDRELLMKRFWSDMGISEIAESMALPYSTVAKRLFRASAKLRERMDPSNG